MVTVALTGLLAACGSSRAAVTRGAPVLSVVTGLWPLQQAAQEIGQGNVRVSDVVPAGANPTTYQPSAAQQPLLAGASLVLLASPALQPGLARVAPPAHTLDLFPAAVAGGPDRWLDPNAMRLAATTIAAALERADPAAKTTFQDGLLNFEAVLSALDTDFSSYLGTCPNHRIVAVDDAFGALDARYGLDVIPVNGASPLPLRPSPADIARQVRIVRAAGVHTVYDEPWVYQDGLLAMQAQTGVSIGQLDPLEGIPPGGFPKGLATYYDEMEQVLGTVSAALGCPISQSSQQ